MNIAVLGGKFDPPHIGHLHLIEEVFDRVSYIDRSLLIPANTRPWRDVYASSADRLMMTKFLETGRISVSDIDIKRGGETYTIDTVRELLKDTDNQYYWIVGADILAEFDKWKDSEKLRKMIKFLVFPRGGHVTASLPDGFSLIPGHEISGIYTSSTFIRERIINGLSIKGLVPEKVEEYIREHRLYTKES